MTKEITCLGGEIILVDDEDYPILSRHKWRYRHSAHGRFYAATQLNIGDDKDWRTIFMHNMILGFAFFVDHIDNDTKNNTKDNLRPATMQKNGWNTRKQKTFNGKPCLSKYKGVSKCIGTAGNVYWRVIIKLSKKGEKPSRFARLGPFATELGAAKAYNDEVVKHRGKWAWINPL